MSCDYPNLYYKILPKIIKSINQDFNGDFSQVTKKQIETIVGEIYIDIAGEYPEIHEDLLERRYKARRNKQLVYYGRSKIITDLITILLMSELSRRNQNFQYSKNRLI